jgi:hypothetical protein
MITLKVTRRRDALVYSITRDGEVIGYESDELLVAARLVKLGVDKPKPVIAAARKWQVVEIHLDRQ